VPPLLLSSFFALTLGAIFGIIQTLHRTDVFRGIISSTDYYTSLTAHGVFLALSFTTFFLVGLFTWAVVRSLDRPLINTKITWTWYGLMAVGMTMTGISILAGFVDSIDMSADVLFTFYAPLQAHPMFYAGLAVFIVGSWIAGADFFRTWLAWKRENPDERIPLQTFMVLTTMAMWYIASSAVAASVLIFLLPWSLGLIDQVNPTTLTRTLFWFFGHPVVYFWLMPAYLLWYTVLPKIAGGRLFSDPLARVVFVLFLLLSTPVGIHHQYLDPGIAEGFKFISMTNTMFLLLPSLLTAFTVVASVEYGARQRGGTGLLGWLTDLPREARVHRDDAGGPDVRRRRLLRDGERRDEHQLHDPQHDLGSRATSTSPWGPRSRSPSWRPPTGSGRRSLTSRSTAGRSGCSRSYSGLSAWH